MADDTTPAPAPKPKRTRGDINRKHLDELAHATTVAEAAADPAYTDALAAVDFDVALPGLIQARAADIREKITKLKGSRTDKVEMTEQEKLAREALVAVILPIQTAAKRKFSPAEKAKREAYYIGSPLQRGGLEQIWPPPTTSSRGSFPERTTRRHSMYCPASKPPEPSKT